jgi:hypothetical protein
MQRTRFGNHRAVALFGLHDLQSALGACAARVQREDALIDDLRCGNTSREPRLFRFHQQPVHVLIARANVMSTKLVVVGVCVRHAFQAFEPLFDSSLLDQALALFERVGGATGEPEDDKNGKEASHCDAPMNMVWCWSSGR